MSKKDLSKLRKGQEARAIWRFLRSDAEGVLKKLAFILVVGVLSVVGWFYGVSPVDLIPDPLPVVGEGDDLSLWGVSAAVVRWFYKDYRDTAVDGDYVLNKEWIKQNSEALVKEGLRQLNNARQQRVQ